MRLRRRTDPEPNEPAPEGTWEVVAPPPGHRCQLPRLGVDDMGTYPEGSIWRCSTCGLRHRIERWVTAGGWADTVPEWGGM